MLSIFILLFVYSKHKLSWGRGKVSCFPNRLHAKRAERGLPLLVGSCQLWASSRLLS